MSDLIQRLKRRANQFGILMVDPPRPTPDAALLDEAADRIKALEMALGDIAEERGVCSKCGKLADMPSNCVSCDNYHACTWDPQNPADIARAALDAKERKE